ncbi:GTPase IMAP family member 7 [Biomphalaria pfeifferi]|uniref:GTPase IMAP family member 7 n=1 Tax=Biomphalaria pfeifferi TaxID=112525 RepID=A0AAD8FFN3_BIOPF|nr:GTPase IMAP family member 7 [Biomphalaria pfeifferi]
MISFIDLVISNKSFKSEVSFSLTVFSKLAVSFIKCARLFSDCSVSGLLTFSSTSCMMRLQVLIISSVTLGFTSCMTSSCIV